MSDRCCRLLTRTWPTRFAFGVFLEIIQISPKSRIKIFHFLIFNPPSSIKKVTTPWTCGSTAEFLGMQWLTHVDFQKRMFI
jgi:hypothetical protein